MAGPGVPPKLTPRRLRKARSLLGPQDLDRTCTNRDLADCPTAVWRGTARGRCLALRDNLGPWVRPDGSDWLPSAT